MANSSTAREAFAMLDTSPKNEELAALRERAQWYRGFAAICSGDNGWCLALAAYNDRLADELERKLCLARAHSAPEPAA